MESYNTVAGDRIDKIVHNHYGDIEMLSQVLVANPALSKVSMCLDAGLEILLPLQEVIANSKTKSTLLW